MASPLSPRAGVLEVGVAVSVVAAAAWLLASDATGVIAGGGAPTSAVAPRPLAQVVFSGDDRGEIEPCGCSAAMLGGLSRRVARLHALRDESSDALVLVGGGLVAGSTAYDRVGLQVALEMLRHAEADVYVASARDVECAAPAALRAELPSGTRVLDGNWSRAASTARAQPGAVRVARGRTRAVVLSLWGDCDDRTADAVSAVRRGLAQDEVLVVVSDGPRERLRALRAVDGGAVLVLCADGVTDPFDTTSDAGSPAFLSLPTGGKYVGVATLVSAGDTQRWQVEYRAVLPELPEEPTVTQAAAARRAALHAMGAAERSSGDPRFAVGEVDVPGEGYAGSAACRSCHAAAWTTWAQSEHARALDTLEAIGQDADPACVRCHVVAYGTGRGFTGDRARGDFAAVGCEACHGPRAGHSASMRSGATTRPSRSDASAREGCFGCHDAKHSSTFDFDAYWRKIQHE